MIGRYLISPGQRASRTPGDSVLSVFYYKKIIKNYTIFFIYCTEDPDYVELIDKRAVREIQHKRDMKARDEKIRSRNEPSGNSDWFLIGDIETLQRNLGTITNPVDQGKIQAKIDYIEKARFHKIFTLYDKEPSEGPLA